ncbi:non-homologous end-joining DNA ligase [Sphingomonas sp. XXL09]|uniref:non-homologous end-joining DNA ligase n=1 Tax=Sphingomonas TaxID=13687 RepID=UPI001F55BC2B|nr:non-homologous end-joining DNA ligase [Sphingomonas sp. JXJ CY 53]
MPVVAPDVPEAMHFISCPECGQAIDCRNLGDVLHHDEPGHDPLPPEARSGPPLGFVEPMLPTLVEVAPDGDDWIHEIKYDGYRTQLVIDGPEIRAFTRNGHDWSERYTPLVAAADALSCRRAIIDGEVIVQDESGRSDFDALRSAIGRAPERLIFIAFDILHLDGTNLRPLAVEQRRDRLEELIGGFDPSSPIHFSADVRGGGRAFFDAVDGMGLEGIVSKKRGSRYQSGRSKSWLKIKAWTEEEFVVVGTEATPGEPVSALLARDTADGLEYAGGAAVTLPSDTREVFYAAAEQLTRDRPLAGMPRSKKARWIEPLMRVRVRHLKGSDKVRHASLVDVTELCGVRR